MRFSWFLPKYKSFRFNGSTEEEIETNLAKMAGFEFFVANPRIKLNKLMLLIKNYQNHKQIKRLKIYVINGIKKECYTKMKSLKI